MFQRKLAIMLEKYLMTLVIRKCKINEHGLYSMTINSNRVNSDLSQKESIKSYVISAILVNEIVQILNHHLD